MPYLQGGGSMTPIVALLYDFDKTLCTTDMEDYAFIPALGYTPACRRGKRSEASS